MKISIDPQVGQWLGIAFAVAGFVATLGPSQFPDYIPVGVVKDIIQTAGFSALIGGGIMTVLGRYSSSAPGPGAPQDSPRVQAAVIEDKKDELAQKAATLPSPK
jgi:drug/metabolite transporter (DMT)-like permease